MDGIAARIGRALGGGAVLVALAACHQANAPKAGSSQAAAAPPSQPANACVQLTSAPGQPQTFKPIAYEDPSLQQCAVHLEGVRLEQGRDVIGMWNGVWIFAGAKEITSANDLSGSRYPIMDPDQRREIDESLQQQLAAQRQASSKPHAGNP